MVTSGLAVWKAATQASWAACCDEAPAAFRVPESEDAVWLGRGCCALVRCTRGQCDGGYDGQDDRSAETLEFHECPFQGVIA